MDMLWWQILLLTIYAGVQILDNLSFGFLAQPVMAGLISGLVMGMSLQALSSAAVCS